MNKKPKPSLPSKHLPRVRVVLPPVPKRFRKVKGEERIQEAFENIPRITNETVAEHRENVLKGARKYKYPLQHSKHRIVITSTVLLVAAVIAFFVYTGLELYKFQSSSAFMYRVTQVLPFPVARAGKNFVSYENYLFELRRYEHYYQTQQRVNFDSERGREQLDAYKPKALEAVLTNAYTKQLASQHGVSVSSDEVSAAMDVLRAQNQSSDQELAAVANKFFGWSLSDLRREVGQELLAQKVATKLDTATAAKANSVLKQVQSGTDFATLAAQYSDDQASKTNGGKYPDNDITLASTDVPAAVVLALQKLQPGQTSGVIQAGQTLEIVKLLSRTDGKITAAHISFNITPIQTYTAQYQKSHPSHSYISVN